MRKFTEVNGTARQAMRRKVAPSVLAVSYTHLDVYKRQDDYWRQDYCYAGTLVIQGSASIRVEKIGVDTEYGKIGVAVGEAPLEATPLQRQTASLVKLCAWIALFLCLFVAIITFINFDAVAFEDRLVGSVLSGITLALAMIPEEFPVILTVFLSMGAWRLAKKNSLIRNLPSAETLGSISVLLSLIHIY